MGFSAILQKSYRLSRLEVFLIFEALSTGYVPASVYLLIHNMCCWIIDDFSSQEQIDKFLPRLTTMEDFSSYCLTELDSGSGAKDMKTTVKKEVKEYVLSGSNMFISKAVLAVCVSFTRIRRSKRR